MNSGTAWHEMSYAVVNSGGLLLLQTTALVGAGLCAAWLFRRKGAAIESTVLRVTLVAVLLCPVISLCMGALGAGRIDVSLPLPAMETASPVPVSSSPVPIGPGDSPTARRDGFVEPAMPAPRNASANVPGPEVDEAVAAARQARLPETAQTVQCRWCPDAN